MFLAFKELALLRQGANSQEFSDIQRASRNLFNKAANKMGAFLCFALCLPLYLQEVERMSL